MDYTVNAQRIKKERIIKGLTMREVAHKAGISYTSIYQLEKGQNKPQPKTIRKICDVLGIRTEEVYHFS